MACAGQKPGGSLFCSHHTWMCSVCIRLKKTAQSASHRQGFWTTTGVHRIYFSLAGEAFNTPKILSRQCLSQTSWEPVMWYPKSIQFCVRLHWKRIMEEPNQPCENWVSGQDENQWQRAVRSNALLLKQSQIYKAAQKEKREDNPCCVHICKCCKTSLVLMKDLAQHDEKNRVKFNTLPINETLGYWPVTYAFCTW